MNLTKFGKHIILDATQIIGVRSDYKHPTLNIFITTMNPITGEVCEIYCEGINIDEFWDIYLNNTNIYENVDLLNNEE